MVKRTEITIAVMPCTRELLRDIAAAEGRHMNIGRPAGVAAIRQPVERVATPQCRESAHIGPWRVVMAPQRQLHMNVASMGVQPMMGAVAAELVRIPLQTYGTCSACGDCGRSAARRRTPRYAARVSA